MARNVLDAPHFQDEAAAFAYVEAHLWPEGPTCPHCGAFGDEVGRLNGKTTRLGLHKCYACKGHFTVRQGSIFESSHLPLHLWLQVIHFMCASKKGISSHQVQRMLRCSRKTAWFVCHRIRAAMKDGSIGPLGSGGGDVEADETYIGRDPDEPHQHVAFAHKMKVLSLVDRETGRVRSMYMDFVTSKTIAEALGDHVSPNARLVTDKARHFERAGRALSGHVSVNHSAGEYVSAIDPTVHTNTVEGTFSIFKRGMRGIYQHCSKKHLSRYLAEFDFRYSNRIALGVDDTQRADNALKGFAGKRLTYETVARRRPGLESRIVW